MSDMDYGGGGSPPAEQRPIPAEGLHDAVCYAVVDWGDVVDDFEGVPKGVCKAVRFYFELDEKMPAMWTGPDGRKVAVDPQYVGKPFALSTYAIKIKYGERAGYRKFLKGWLGSECPEKLPGFPLGTLKGRMASINVAHRMRDDGTYAARIENVMRGRAGVPPWPCINTALPHNWKEMREKDNKAAAAYLRSQGMRAADASEADPPAPEGGFDEVPFQRHGAAEE